MQRGDVWLVALDPVIGSAIQKTRPCVVVSPPEMHGHLRTAIVAPMTTQGRPAPFRVPVSFMGKDGLILLDQMRAVDKVRLSRKAGAVPPGTLRTTLRTLHEIFAD
ncbi:type II toxin-antitoxin system PemK/MazF family toxin [Paracidovorax citrulli]